MRIAFLYKNLDTEHKIRKLQYELSQFMHWPQFTEQHDIFGFTLGYKTKAQLVQGAKSLSETIGPKLDAIAKSIFEDFDKGDNHTSDWTLMYNAVISVKNCIEWFNQQKNAELPSPSMINCLKAAKLSITESQFCDFDGDLNSCIILAKLVGEQNRNNHLLLDSAPIILAHSWYKVLFDVYKAMSADTIQKDTTKYNGNLNNWGENTGG